MVLKEKLSDEKALLDSLLFEIKVIIEISTFGTNNSNIMRVTLDSLEFDDEEMNAVTAGHDSYHAPWRQADYDFFMSDMCKKIIEEEDLSGLIEDADA